MNKIFQTVVNTPILRTFSRRPLIQLQLISEYSKDLVKTEPPLVQDFLYQNLKNATSTNKVLELVSDHHKIMNRKHLIQALRSLFALQKHGSTSFSSQEIVKNAHFNKICHYLKSQAGSIELNDTIEALKVLSFLGVSSNSTIIQVLLQLIRHNINQLNLQQIMFMDFLLYQFKPSPLVDALQIALPIVFEIQLPQRMDRNNLSHLLECFHYATKKNLSADCIEMIVKSIQRSPNELDARMAISIIWSITDVKADEFFEPLLNTALNTVILNIDSLTYNEIETTISKLINKYTSKLSFYYNETFFDVATNYLIERDLGFDAGIYLLWKFNKIDHFNLYLLDYLFKKASENPDLIMKNQQSKICNLIIGVALTDYRPVCFDSLLNHLEQYSTSFVSNGKEVLWTKLAASLCILGIYERTVMERALAKEFFHKILKRKFKSDFDQILCVNQALRTYKPEFADILPTQDKIEDIALNCFHSKESSLQIPLQKALGGEMYVKTKLISTLGHLIDHAIMYRQGGFPVAFNTSEDPVQYIERIVVPPDNQLILILELAPEHYCINGKKLKSIVTMSIKTLEARGYTVLPICLKEWNALADFEKFPYLMQAIKLKLRSDVSQSSNVV